MGPLLASIVGAMLAVGGTTTLWPQVVHASPFDPRPPPKSPNGPFFEGWFIRLVDHQQRLTFSVIIGSLRSSGKGGREYDEHYVALSYHHEPRDEDDSSAGDVRQSTPHDEEVESMSEPSESAAMQERDGGPSAQEERTWSTAKRILGWVREHGRAGRRALGGHQQGRRKGTRRIPGQVRKASADTSETDGDHRWEDDDGNDNAADAGDVPGTRGRLGREGLASEGNVANPRGPFDIGTPTDTDRPQGHSEGIVEDGREASGEVDDYQENMDMEEMGERTRSSPGASQGAESTWRTGSRERNRERDLGAPESRGGRIRTGTSTGKPSRDQIHTFHAFPPADTVVISRAGEPVRTAPNMMDEPNFTWEADGIGSFMVDGDAGRLSFQLPELSVAASFRHRTPWDKRFPNSAGPEGWLAYTNLLPTHYFVYSLGSEAGYSLKPAGATEAIVGRGVMHMEVNYGQSFPTGWIWAQGCSASVGLGGELFQDGEVLDSGASSAADDESDASGSPTREAPAKFILTGGKFVIGPFTTNSFVLGFRSEKHRWDFRSTDLDRIKYTVRRRENRVSIVAKSRAGGRMLKADIEAPEGSFGDPIYVPTERGFSNKPGCLESFSATARFRLYTRRAKAEGDAEDPSYVLSEEVEFQLAALEFGGDFQDT